jgi:hypothetical protein
LGEDVNPRYERAASRLASLIEEGEAVARLEKSSTGAAYDAYIQGRDKIALHAWLTKVENILEMVFGRGGAHFRQYTSLTERQPEHSYEVFKLVGLLHGALDDLQAGYLEGQQHLVAGVVFESVLEQAQHLVKAGFKDPAAVLGRVVAEDALRRLAQKHSCDATAKAAAINDAMRDKAVYSKPQWRAVQSWLDIGNAAAHGDFGAYTQEDVERMLGEVGQFAVTAYRA